MEKSNTCSCGIANPWLQIGLRSAFQPNGLELPNAAVPAAKLAALRHRLRSSGRGEGVHEAGVEAAAEFHLSRKFMNQLSFK